MFLSLVDDRRTCYWNIEVRVPSKWSISAARVIHINVSTRTSSHAFIARPKLSLVCLTVHPSTCGVSVSCHFSFRILISAHFCWWSANDAWIPGVERSDNKVMFGWNPLISTVFPFRFRLTRKSTYLKPISMQLLAIQPNRTRPAKWRN